MRQVKEYVTEAGERRYRVRYRSDGERSETFRSPEKAKTFAALLDTGRDGVRVALEWLAAQEQAATTETFGAYFDGWVEELTGITPRTRDDYKAMRRRYLTELDPLPLTVVSRAHVARIVNRLDADGLSPKTIKNVMHMLSSVFGLAIDDGLVTRNPTKRVRLPKQSRDESEVQFLTHEEAALLIAATPKHYQPLVTFLLGTGLRWSEATALQHRDIDLANGTVRVRRAWKRVPGGWEVGPPKSEKSRRTVNAAVPALVAVATLTGKPNDLVFTTPRGGVVRHSNFYNRVWVPAVEDAGLEPKPTIHSCRHTFASWLISDGIPLEAVQEQLGHESYETTRRVYAHLLPAVGVAAGRSASAAMMRVLAQSPDLRALGWHGSLGHAVSVELDERRDAQHVAADMADGSASREGAGGVAELLG